MAAFPSRRASDQLNSSRLTAGLVTWLFLGAGIVAVGALAVFLWRQGEEAPSRDSSPNWSPDGRRIVFAADAENGTDLFVMNANGSDRLRLTDNGEAEGAPAFSPDGRRIAFHTNRDGNFEIYTMDAEGGDLLRVTNSTARDTAPSWSPDGRRLVFTSNRDRTDSTDLYSATLDGEDVEPWTASGVNDTGRFSPDGRRLAFEADRKIAVLDVVTRRLSKLTDGQETCSSPTWSPNGSQIAYVRRQNDQSELFVMEADGANPRLLVSMASGSVVSPAWSPDGAKIAYVYLPDDPSNTSERKLAAIYVIEIDADRVTRLSP